MSGGRKYLYCQNCYAVLAKNADFCHRCGQKRTDGRKSLLSFFQEFFSTLFNLDNRVFRSIRALFIPARLTEAYFSGQHKKYIHPFRLLVFSVVLLITTFSIIGSRDILVSSNSNYLEEVGNVERQKIYFLADSVYQDIKEQVNGEEASHVLDTFYSRFVIPIKENTLDSLDVFQYKDGSFSSEHCSISIQDAVKLSPKEIIDKYNIEGWLNQTLLQQYLRIRIETDTFGNYLIGKFIWFILVFLPIIALLLKLLYIRNDYYYVEHLVFIFHIHCLLFFVLTLLLIGSNLLEFDLLKFGGTAYYLFYLYFSFKNYYQQPHWKTFIKIFLVMLIYNFLAAIIAILMALLGFFLF